MPAFPRKLRQPRRDPIDEAAMRALSRQSIEQLAGDIDDAVLPDPRRRALRAAFGLRSRLWPRRDLVSLSWAAAKVRGFIGRRLGLRLPSKLAAVRKKAARSPSGRRLVALALWLLCRFFAAFASASSCPPVVPAAFWPASLWR